jgi:hypothetical protein
LRSPSRRRCLLFRLCGQAQVATAEPRVGYNGFSGRNDLPHS